MKRKVTFAVGIFFMIPMVYGIGLFAVTIDAIIEYENVNKSLEPVPVSEFMEGNTTVLRNKTRDLEYRLFKYHMDGQGLMLNTRFTGSDVLTPSGSGGTQFGGHADCPIWTGHLLASQGFKYAVAKREGNAIDRVDALQNVSIILEGLNFLTQVTGVPGRLARYAWYDDPGGVNRSIFGDPEDNPNKNWDSRRYEGEWQGDPYIWDGAISRDQHAGLLLGLGVIEELVAPHNSTIKQKVKLMVENLVDFMITSDWRGVDAGNTTTGTDFRPGYDIGSSDGAWQLSFLQLGRRVNPAKYESMYHHHALDLNQVERIGNFHEINTNWNLRSKYYGNNINFVQLFNLIRLETDPAIHDRMVHAMKKTVWKEVKYHRNAHFNMLYLGASRKTNESGTLSMFDPEMEYIINDTLDGLMRHGSDPKHRDSNGRYCIKDIVPTGVYYKYEYQFHGGWDPPGMYNTTTDELMYRIDPIYFKYHTFLQGIGGSWLNDIFSFSAVSDEIVPVDLRPVSDFTWQRSPYKIFAGENLRSCYPGVDVILPYWMGRYYRFWGDG
ncbi:hypothetical protein GF325_03285 [Candidatus Bathyarchaeota archaeon]|nr:hypothetical protein [Candidatus Bathyarchaeota archaeon]